MLGSWFSLYFNQENKSLATTTRSKHKGSKDQTSETKFFTNSPSEFWSLGEVVGVPIGEERGSFLMIHA